MEYFKNLLDKTYVYEKREMVGKTIASVGHVNHCGVMYFIFTDGAFTFIEYVDLQYDSEIMIVQSQYDIRDYFTEYGYTFALELMKYSNFDLEEYKEEVEKERRNRKEKAKEDNDRKEYEQYLRRCEKFGDKKFGDKNIRG